VLFCQNPCQVCNHPDLFEPRPITTPFILEPLIVGCNLRLARAVTGDVHLTGSMSLNKGSRYVKTDRRRHPQQTSILLCPNRTCTLSPNLTDFWDLSRFQHYDCDKDAQSSAANFVDLDDMSMELPIPTAAIASSPRLLAYFDAYRSHKRSEILHTREFNSRISGFRLHRLTFRYCFQLFDAVQVDNPVDCLRAAVEREEFYHLQTTNGSGTDDIGGDSDWERMPFVSKNTNKNTIMCSSIAGLIRSLRSRAHDVLDTIEQFVFVIPGVLGRTNELSCAPPLRPEAESEMVTAARAMDVFYPSFIRQRIFFPDRKLVQFDAGKLQKLASLLRTLKKGNHKCLIFTQMSKMLDILEIFLNLNGHTYVRLDGSTSVDMRGKLMEKFNSDPKIFCFILSTRSGGSFPMSY
jgi:SNF2 family DNA or RNA helicase